MGQLRHPPNLSLVQAVVLMAVILGQFPITYRIVGVPRSKAADAVIEVTAARAFAHMTRRWPVDTASVPRRPLLPARTHI